MKNKISKLFFSLTGLFVLICPVLVLAGGTITDAPPSPVTPIADFQLRETIEGIANWAFWIVIMLAMIFLLVAAVGFLTAGGDSNKITVARDRLIYALIGVAVALLAWALINWIAGFF